MVQDEPQLYRPAREAWCRCLYCKTRPGFDVLEALVKHVEEKHPLLMVPSWNWLHVYMFLLVDTKPTDWEQALCDQTPKAT